MKHDSQVADATEEIYHGTEAISPIHRKKFVTRGMLFKCAKPAWLEYLERKMDHFGIPSLEAQDSLLKRRSSSVASAAGEGQALRLQLRTRAFLMRKMAIGTWRVLLPRTTWSVLAKSFLRSFQDSPRAKKRKVSETVAEAFELSTELLNLDITADACPSTELVSMMTALTTAQSEA